MPLLDRGERAGPYSIITRFTTLLLAALSAMLLSPGRSLAELTVTIEEEDPALVVEGLEPYSTAAVFSIWLEQISSGPHHQQTTLHLRLEDEDGDGIVRYDMGRDAITFWNRWLVADLETGETGEARWPWYANPEDADDLIRVRGGGLFWVAFQVEAAWIRPGVGHWKAPPEAFPWIIREGGPLDADGQSGNGILMRPEVFTWVEDEDPAPPTAFADGDVLLLQDTYWARFKIVTFDGPYVSFDIDGNRKDTPLTDGMLALRYLLDKRGTLLTEKVTGAGCARCDGDAIALYLDSILPLLDLDGDGSASPQTDGVLLMRYLFGLRGEALVEDAVGLTCSRCSGSAIAAHLHGWR